MSHQDESPRKRWMLILGVVGFAAGFFGPMIFVPEANQGPLVGILMTGPGGLALGLLLYGLCSLFKVSARNQWRMLYATAVAGVVTIMLCVQPSPALQGTMFEAEIVSCASPAGVEADTFKYWDRRIAEVTWAEPRAGWREDMHAALQSASGAVVAVQMKRTNSVFENRKFWNRGSLFVSGWKADTEQKSFYRPVDSCAAFPAGRVLLAFQSHELGGKIEPPATWPPKEVERVIDAGEYSDVPERFAALR